ncbi:MAG: formate dehydrogenase accessory sulfurtransferase FdhD, partial [Thermoplasmata archaeon]
RVHRAQGGRTAEVRDVVAVEEPLEIQVVETREGREHAHSLSVTMRTPGNDFELVAGFLFAEDVLQGPEDFWRIEYCVPEDAPQEFNVVSVVLKESVPLDLSHTLRSFYTTSACGVCGKATLDAVKVRDPIPVPPNGPEVHAAQLAAWPEALRREQNLFDQTGGLHAAALFDGETLVSLREDIGRHNAVDKVVGEQFLAGTLPLHNCALMVSGRASFDILQKAVAAGIPFVAAVGAPSSLAVDLANEFGLTLVGFLRQDSFNIYAGRRRVVS